MTEEQNERAVIGGNNPPEEIKEPEGAREAPHVPTDPIDRVTAEYADTIEEAQNWLDGEKVENEGQLAAVDAILKDFKKYKTALTEAGKKRTAPLHEAWKAEVAAVKVYTDDADRMQKGLVAISADFKKKLAAEKAEEERRLRAEAEEKHRAAEEAARAADPGDIEATRAAADAIKEAKKATTSANKAAKSKPKGFRTIHHFEVVDYKALINWIAQNDKGALTAFMDEWARQNHRNHPEAAGLKTWMTKEPF